MPAAAAAHPASLGRGGVAGGSRPQRDRGCNETGGEGSCGAEDSVVRHASHAQLLASVSGQAVVPAANAPVKVKRAWHVKRFSEKMKNRRLDKDTVCKGQRIFVVAMAGLGFMVVDLTMMTSFDHDMYAWSGTIMRPLLSLNCVVLVGQLYDYYAFMLKRKRSEHSPSVQHFWQEPHFRHRFLLEALLALFHPLPTGFPIDIPRRGECRMAGWDGHEPVEVVSDRCHHVYGGFVGLLMFVRIYHGLRVFRDSTSIWRLRSLIKSAATPHFSWFPDIRVQMASMYYVHQFPIRCLAVFFCVTVVSISFVLYIVEAWQENCEEDIFFDDNHTLLMGIIDTDSRCSPQVIRSWVQALWVVSGIMFQTIFGDAVPTSHVARLMCVLATVTGLCIQSSIIALFARSANVNEYEKFALNFLQHRRAKRRVALLAAIYMQRHYRNIKRLPEYKLRDKAISKSKHASHQLAVARHLAELAVAAPFGWGLRLRCAQGRSFLTSCPPLSTTHAQVGTAQFTGGGVEEIARCSCALLECIRRPRLARQQR